jgi:nitrite reductase (NADH) small subunit
VFRTVDDRVFAIDDRCPHKGGPLSQGIVHGNSVTCPLHNWVISLESGKAQGADEGCVRTIPLKVEEGTIYIAGQATAHRAA